MCLLGIIDPWKRDKVAEDNLVDQINAEPTKAFFVDMFTRDIPLEQAVLDLVDNCVDGAKRLKVEGDLPFDGRFVDIKFDDEAFNITDNCGGFSKEIAREYAFRFGRPAETPKTESSIGQFGVGMKRALFKFGRHFRVSSATNQEEWAVDVDVPTWELEPGWHFPWADFKPDANLSKKKPGTEIIVTELRTEVARTFDTKNFENSIISLVKSKHRTFIREGLDISVNGKKLEPISLAILSGQGAEGKKLTPGVKFLKLPGNGPGKVSIKIVAGIGASTPRFAGWYVIGNGRIILDADRRDVTGWGAIEDASGKVLVPGFHNQFARFRGVVSFESNDSSDIPWNTMKTDVDLDSPIWREAREAMLEMMRPVIDFLNELDADIDAYTREKSPLYHFVESLPSVRPENLTKSMEFSGPERSELSDVIKTVKIQYARDEDDIEFLKDQLGVRSAKAVGETTFDLILERQRKR
jgi:hypothetical protein